MYPDAGTQRQERPLGSTFADPSEAVWLTGSRSAEEDRYYFEHPRRQLSVRIESLAGDWRVIVSLEERVGGRCSRKSCASRPLDRRNAIGCGYCCCLLLAAPADHRISCCRCLVNLPSRDSVMPGLAVAVPLALLLVRGQDHNHSRRHLPNHHLHSWQVLLQPISWSSVD
jgi:hypothetical protein